MPIVRATVDAVVLGGGVAGLWIAARLRAAGYAAVVVETATLGAGQTICSQGIIHGGVKYSLGGEVTDATRSIAAMPAVWGACLAGERNAPLDLRGVAVLSHHYYLWTSRGLGARLAGLAASAVIRANVERIAPEHRPPGLAGAGAGIDVYRVGEPVLDPSSMLRTLRDAAEGPGQGPAPISAAPADALSLSRLAGAWKVGFRASDRAGTAHDVELRTRWVVLAAGAGNEALLRMAGDEASEGASMQRRPLHMVMARGELPAMYAHWVAGATSTPRATVTSQRDAEGRMVWYIGGGLAEDGVARTRESQIDAARAELRLGAPWIAWDGVQWATLRIDRAEAATKDGRRPEGPWVRERAGVITCWPTKLAFAPAVAGEALAIVQGGGGPSAEADARSLATLEPAQVAALPWEEVGVQWS